MYSIEKNDKSVVLVKITVEGEEFKSIKNEIMAKYKNAKVDGFRKGHVPTDVIEKEFAGNIREDLYNKVVNEEFAKALKESNEEPMTRLEVISENITKDKLEVEISFEAVPQFELPKYKGLEIEFDKVADVTEEDVENTLNSIAKRSTKKEISTKEVAENKDLVDINFEGFVDGVAFEGGKAENFDLLLGSHQFIDTFEEQIVGHKVGDEFEVNVVFPAEYHAENLKGKPAMFKVKLNAIKEEKVPEINDELAKSNGQENLDEFKKTIKSQLEAQRLDQAKSAKFQKIADKLVEALDIFVPEKARQEEADREINEFKNQIAQYGQKFEDFLARSGKTVEEFNKDAFERAENAIKFRLIAGKIIKEEKLNINQEDIDKSLADMASQYNMTLDQIKEELTKMNLLENYQNDIANNLVTEKLRTFLIENNENL